MSVFSPDSLAEITGGFWSMKPSETLSGFAFDARQIKPQECFVALSGGARDGHEFLEQAGAAGASSAMVERICQSSLPMLVVDDTLDAMARIARAVRNRFDRPLIGITGSSGKTSTKEMLRLLLGEDRVHATPGNWNNRIGVPMTLFQLDSRVQEFAVVEAGINQPGEMRELGGMIHADLTLITNIGTAHLELLKSQEGIADEKSQLAVCAKPASPIVMHADLLAYRSFANLASRAIIALPLGDSLPAIDVRAVYRFRIGLNSDEMTTVVSIARENQSESEITFNLHSTSRGMAENSVLAVIACLELGLDPMLLAARLSHWTPGATRGRITTIGDCFVYADCYNANPDSMVDAFHAFEASAPEGHARTYVIGVMNELGAASRSMHRETGGQLRLRAQDRAIFVGPENLTEAYFEGALSAGARIDQLAKVESTAAIESEVAQAGGALFLKGSRSVALETLNPKPKE